MCAPHCTGNNKCSQACARSFGACFVFTWLLQLISPVIKPPRTKNLPHNTFVLERFPAILISGWGREQRPRVPDQQGGQAIQSRSTSQHPSQQRICVFGYYPDMARPIFSVFLAVYLKSIFKFPQHLGIIFPVDGTPLLKVTFFSQDP